MGNAVQCPAFGDAAQIKRDGRIPAAGVTFRNDNRCHRRLAGEECRQTRCIRLTGGKAVRVKAPQRDQLPNRRVEIAVRQGFCVLAGGNQLGQDRADRRGLTGGQGGVQCHHFAACRLPRVKAGMELVQLGQSLRYRRAGLGGGGADHGNHHPRAEHIAFLLGAGRLAVAGGKAGRQRDKAKSPFTGGETRVSLH